MIIRVPITGEIIEFDPKHPEVSSGSPDNPVRPLDFNKLLPDADFTWRAIEYDFAGGFVTLEITFKKKTFVTEWDNSKTPPEPIAWRTESDAEFYKRQADTEKALQATFEKNTTNELYQMAGEPKLVKPIK